MSSPAQPLISMFRNLPQNALDVMDGDTERGWLANKLNMPWIAPQGSQISAPRDTSWHDRMVRDANASFLPKQQPSGKLYQRGGKHGR